MSGIYVYVAPPQEFSGSSPKRRRAEEKDEGIGSPDAMEEEKMEELRREILELRQQLDKERSARMQVEDEVKSGFIPRANIYGVDPHRQQIVFVWW